MRLSSSGFGAQPHEAGNHANEKRCLNSELWHACAGPLVSLPAVGSQVVYFPQGHSEQVAASTNKEVDSHLPNYPSLPPQLICQLHNVTMHADVETDEVYAQMTLQPLSPQEPKDAYLPAELGNPSKQPTNYFCKTLTASDTSTHGGFSVPRRAAEKVFPPLDFSQQPPAQELIARDLHDNEWKFRHIFRGQPKRHLLTTGWSVFVSAKRLVAGDSVIFIWNEKNQLLLGIRHANRPQTVMPSSVLSSDSMHIGLFAAAAHAAKTNSPFTIFYNPRASPSEFVIPLTKYLKAVYHTRVSVGMRFRMLFETEESSVRRYMGTITGISDLDPVRWLNSHWRSVKVGWDESTAGERQPRVSLWEIEPLTTFPMYPSPFPLRLKRPWPSGLPILQGIKDEDLGLNSSLMWLRGDGSDRGVQSLSFQGLGVNPWMQQRFDSSLLGMQPDEYHAMAAAALQEMRNVDVSKQAAALLQFQQPQNMSCRPVPFPQRNFISQSQPQSQVPLLQTIQETLPRTHVLQHQLQHQHLFKDQQFQHQQHQKNQHLIDQHHTPQRSFQIPNIASALSQLSSCQTTSPLQNISSMCQEQGFADSSGNHVMTSNMSVLPGLLGSITSDDSPHLLNLRRTDPLLASTGWSSKRLAVESVLPSGGQCILPPVEQFGSQPFTNPSSLHSLPFPSFPGADCVVEQVGIMEAQSNHVPFIVNRDSSPQGMPTAMSGIRSAVTDNNQMSMTFAGSNYSSVCATDFPLNSTMEPSGCLDGNGFVPSPDSGGLINPSRTFVKVHKSGSYGRSLDISRFRSYHELRGELARLFGLEGQLEDPLRSGWQLVFVDRENDVLLLGDDPWQEFVNNVWYIKILSPQEVQLMGRQDLELLNSVSLHRQASSSCDDFTNRQDSRNLSSGITSVGSLDC